MAIIQNSEFIFFQFGSCSQYQIFLLGSTSLSWTSVQGVLDQINTDKWNVHPKMFTQKWKILWLIIHLEEIWNFQVKVSGWNFHLYFFLFFHATRDTSTKHFTWLTKLFMEGASLKSRFVQPCLCVLCLFFILCIIHPS